MLTGVGKVARVTKVNGIYETLDDRYRTGRGTLGDMRL